MDDFELIGTGLTVFEHDEPVEGPVRLAGLADGGARLRVRRRVADESIVLARGGTTTFLTPALTGGVKGVHDAAGRPGEPPGHPEPRVRHPVPDVGGRSPRASRSGRGEIIPADGTVVRMDVSGSPRGPGVSPSRARGYDRRTRRPGSHERRTRPRGAGPDPAAAGQLPRRDRRTARRRPGCSGRGCAPSVLDHRRERRPRPDPRRAERPARATWASTSGTAWRCGPPRASPG